MGLKKVLALSLFISALSFSAHAEDGVNDDGVNNGPRYNEDGTPYTGDNGPVVCEGPCDSGPRPVITEGSNSNSNSNANNSNNQSAIDSYTQQQLIAADQAKSKAERQARIDAAKAALKAKYNFALLSTPQSRQQLIDQHKELKSTLDAYKNVVNFQNTDSTSSLLNALKALRKK